MKQPPYTLAQILANFEIMKDNNTDLKWCRQLAFDVLDRGIAAVPDDTEHRRANAIAFLDEESHESVAVSEGVIALAKSLGADL